MGDTSISWTGKTWNPTDGCECISPGCANCYAMRMAGRFSRPGEPYAGLVTIGKNKRAIWNGDGHLVPHKLGKPLHWRKPALVFVNSMSDLFYEKFTNDEIAAVFGVMASTPRHTYQILTKRAERMREWFAWYETELHGDPGGRLEALGDLAKDHLPDHERGYLVGRAAKAWPLPNVWLGVSTENQETADGRIPWLLETPAAVRFISAEPLLEAINISTYLDPAAAPCGETSDVLDWVIVGCESGPKARPCGIDWIRSIRDQVAAARVDLFVKQAVASVGIVEVGMRSRRKPGGVIELPYLDGVQHNAMPRMFA